LSKVCSASSAFILALLVIKSMDTGKTVKIISLYNSTRTGNEHQLQLVSIAFSERWLYFKLSFHGMIIETRKSTIREKITQREILSLFIPVAYSYTVDSSQLKLKSGSGSLIPKIWLNFIWQICQLVVVSDSRDL